MDANKLVYPDYLLFKRRLQSFTAWPPQISQQKTDLANAGFFYSNVSDKVTCFACGVVLCGWRPWDDPWIEHDRHTRSCLYLKMVGGVRLFTNGVIGLSTSHDQHECQPTPPPTLEHRGLRSSRIMKGKDEPDRLAVRTG